MLRLTGVSCASGRVTLIDGVTLDVEPGTITAVVGRNGAGKSVLLQAMAGIRPCDRGTVALDEQDLESIGRRDRARRVTYMPQEHGLALPFSVREVATMGRHPHVGRFAALGHDDVAIVERSLEALDVGHLAQRTYPTLSAGERQRVLLARCFATEAALLVLDEPTASLDIGHALSLFEKLRTRVAAGATVVVALHDLNLAARYADRCVVMDGGRVVADAAPEVVLLDAAVNSAFGISTRVLPPMDGIPVFVFLRRPEAP